MIDRTLANEIRLLSKNKELHKELNAIAICLQNRYAFDVCVQKFGRAKVALCVSSTMVCRNHHYFIDQLRWAFAVANLWNTTDYSRSRAVIDIHAGILADNAISLMKMTTVVA